MADGITSKDAILHVRRYIATVAQPEHMSQEAFEEMLVFLEQDIAAWRAAAKQERTPERPVPDTRVDTLPGTRVG
jgi:hypothetical protein